MEEKISRNLNVPYVTMKDKEGNTVAYVCQNGVLITDKEYRNGIDLKKVYNERSKGDILYDFEAAKKGVLKKLPRVESSKVPSEPKVKSVVKEKLTTEKIKQGMQNKSVMIIVILLGFTSVISMYISTLHTATYLVDYVDLISAWFMSASVTAYNSTAFEVSVLFHTRKRNFMAVVFMFLWILVTLFSMATTVSVFYDQFNFTENKIAEENKEADSAKAELELLQKKELALREDINFKKKDIEYRQEREWATTAVRNELTKLQDELQKNLTSQQEIMSRTPEVVTDNGSKRKESLFTFLGRLLHLEGGILEFIMSTMSAIFINLIAPLSLTAVVELMKKDLTK